ncbi:MAG: hypothetical protein WBR29_07375 [Gammaproteobacteria bacterium]
MKQSRAASLIEAIINICVGFGLSVGFQATVLPLLGVDIPITANLSFALVMTGVSICRQFILRRMFEALHIRRPLSPAMAAIIAERFRQIEVEGWSIVHDDTAHAAGELANAGAHYAFYAGRDVAAPSTWPWSHQWWKPQNFRRDLVRAAALIVAEIERFDRHRNAASLRPRPLQGGYQPAPWPPPKPPRCGASGVAPSTNKQEPAGGA